jgi:peroxiredoxin
MKMTLKQEIENFQKEMIPNIPKDVLHTLQRTSAELMAKNLEDRALKQGDTIPAFTLPDATGTQVSSEQLLMDGPIVISFYRGGWCPYCNLELKALQNILPEIKALNAQLVAISPELPDHSLATKEKHTLEFSVLSDQGNQVARSFGLVFELDKELAPMFKDKFNWDLIAINGTEKVELPIPATYVVGKAGVAQFAFVNSDYSQRAEPELILNVLQNINES